VKVLEAPLDGLSRDARAYPAHLLREGETGLCLFSAAFLGINDAIHMARMNMTVTCVDTAADRIEQMEALYPSYWSFGVVDAWEFAEGARAVRGQWDVVSVDTFTGDATTRSLETIELWTSLARRHVTMTIANEHTRGSYVLPDGWRDARYNRGGLADWLVLTRD
jgi:hypothetical protein